MTKQQEIVSRRRATIDKILGSHGGAVAAEAARRSLAIVRSKGTALGRRTNRLLTELRDRHAGKRCVIVGNGPSLNKTNLALLRDEVTFGLNRIYLMHEKLGFRPTYQVVVNRLVVEQCAADFHRIPGLMFSSWPNHDLLGQRPQTAFLQPRSRPQFSTDCRKGVWEGATVTYVALQIAYHMGFNKVILVGVDHRFKDRGPAHKTVTSEGSDANHFDPNYFGKGFRWQLPDLETSEIAYGLARQAFEADGRKVVDATVDGALQIFPKAQLEVELD